MSANRDFDFEEQLVEAAMQFQVDNATQFSRDRRISVGASEIGRCIKAARYTKDDIISQGESPPQKNLKGGFMMRGKILEDYFIVPVIKSIFGDKGELLGDDQQTFLAKESEYLTATPDGKYGNEFLVEFKTFDPRTTLESPKPEHVMQCIVQMGVTGIKTHTKLCYFNASDLFNIIVFRIDYNEDVYQSALNRAEQIMTSNVLDLPKEGLFIDGCKYCSYRELCRADKELDPKPKNQKKVIDTPPNKRITTVYNKLVAAKQAIKDARKEAGRIENDLIQLLENIAGETASIDGVNLKLVQKKGRRSLDKVRLNTYLEEQGTNLDSFFNESEEPQGKKLKIEPHSKRRGS